MFEPHSSFFCLAAAMVRAGDMCPAPPKYHAPFASDIAADDHRIHIDTDDAAARRRRQCRADRPRQVRQDAAQRHRGFGHLRLQDRPS